MNNNSDKDDRDDDLIVNYKIDNQQNFLNKKTKFNVTKPEIDLNSKVFDSNEKLTIIDSTPNPIYYRNLLSVTGTFKSRPTLEQLQVINCTKRIIFIYFNMKLNFFLNMFNF